METTVKQDLAALVPASPAPQTRGVSTRYPIDVLLQDEKNAVFGSAERELPHHTPPTSDQDESPPVSPVITTTAPHYTTLRHTTLHHTTLHHVTLLYNPLH